MKLLKMISGHKTPTYPLEFEIAGLFAYEAKAKELMGKNPSLEKARKTAGKRIYVLAPLDAFCELVPEKKNKHDKNAIMIIVNGHHIGYVPKDRQEEVSKRMKAKQKSIVKLLGGNYRIYEDGEWVTYKGSIRGTVTMVK